MAKSLLIKASLRENKKPNALRASGFVPATIYGHGFKSQSVQINAKEFSKVPYKAYSHINELEIDGQKYPVLIRNVQLDPIRDKYLNVEFYRIKSDEKIKVKVPLNFIGHSPAVTAGGVLIVSLNEVEVQCLPKDIPDTIDVSLDQIVDIGQTIHASELKVLEHVHILAKPEEVIVHVEIPKTHVVEEATPTATPGVTPAEGAAPVEGAPAASTAPGGKETTPQTPAKAPESAKQPKK